MSISKRCFGSPQTNPLPPTDIKMTPDEVEAQIKVFTEGADAPEK
jgi:hypothetical protein